MKSPICALAFLGIAAAATPAACAESPAFTWTVSASDQDPHVNTLTPWEGLRDLYVWVIPREDVGLSACHFDLITSGDIYLLALIPINGFLNMGAPPTCGWIYATYCREEPVAGARLLVYSAGIGGAICMSACYGTNCSTSCDLREYENSYIGFSSDGSGPCAFTTYKPCSPITVGEGTWGSIKATYR